LTSSPAIMFGLGSINPALVLGPTTDRKLELDRAMREAGLDHRGVTIWAAAEARAQIIDWLTATPMVANGGDGFG
jgi:hypothetical protein